MATLTADERRRYSRNIMLSGIGAEGQERLLQSKVLIVGCGALGSVCAMYLAGSGVGMLGLVDFDTVDISNLQRQLSYTITDIGQSKAGTLASKIRDINPAVNVKVYDTLLTGRSAGDIISEYDIIVEGSDNPDTKYLISDMCADLKKNCVMGGIAGTQGQVICFAHGHASYRDFFPEAAAPDGFTPCSLGGVLGPLPGIVGSIQAAETVKIITGLGKPMFDTLLLIDAGNMEFNKLTIYPDNDGGNL